jgi:hypothetical protein
MKQIHKHYKDFSDMLNKSNIRWCFIKDLDYLQKTGYDNEVDLIIESKDRSEVRRIGRMLGWHESTLNSFNTHLIFWRFEKDIPFRIDVHVGRALATAVPWLSAKDILDNRVKTGNFWTVAPACELAIILLTSFRNRVPKQHRVARAKALQKHLDETKNMLQHHLSEAEVDQYYNNLIQGNMNALSKWKRLGSLNYVKEKILHVSLLFARFLRPSPVIFIAGRNESYRDEVSRQFVDFLRKSKMSVKTSSSFDVFRFWKRITADVVIMNSATEDRNAVVLDQKDGIKNSLRRLVLVLSSTH